MLRTLFGSTCIYQYFVRRDCPAVRSLVVGSGNYDRVPLAVGERCGRVNKVLCPSADVKTSDALAYELGTTFVVYELLQFLARERPYINHIARWD